MALPKDLKSDMTGMPVFEPESEAAETVVPQANDTEAIPMAEPFLPTAPEVPDVPEKTEDVLKRVEEQLDSIAQMLSSQQPTMVDLSGVNATLARIEQQIAGIGAPSNDDKLKALEMAIESVVEKLDRNDRQLTQDLRENATFRVQVRQGMQHDLDELKEQMSGEQFNPILKEIATVYSEYQVLLEEDLPPRARKNLLALFEQLEDILDDYGAEAVRSEVGSVRKTRSCKIINKVMTTDSELHNTIVTSRKPGVVRGQMVLYQELVDVYVFDPNAPAPQSENTSGEVPVEDTPIADSLTGE